MSEAYLKEVRDQYEVLPYPHRNPEDERIRLNSTFGSSLEYISHYGFQGKLNAQNMNILTCCICLFLKHCQRYLCHMYNVSFFNIRVAYRCDNFVTAIWWCKRSINGGNHLSLNQVMNHLKEGPACKLFWCFTDRECYIWKHPRLHVTFTY